MNIAWKIFFDRPQINDNQIIVLPWKVIDLVYIRSQIQGPPLFLQAKQRTLFITLFVLCESFSSKCEILCFDYFFLCLLLPLTKFWEVRRTQHQQKCMSMEKFLSWYPRTLYQESKDRFCLNFRAKIQCHCYFLRIQFTRID